MSEGLTTSQIQLKPDQPPVPVVAIGASAGGIEAAKELFQNLPADTGLAFVYIQHPSPTYNSPLDIIISGVTKMPVLKAEHLMPAKPDHVYIIPPNKNMEISDGVLSLTTRRPKLQIHMPIGQFFISLAERQKDGAIGVILSGTASDGTLGLKAIKVAGGITFAQDESAMHQGMPQAAISEGVVDRVLSVKEIAHEIQRLSQRAAIFKLTNETAEMVRDETTDADPEKILILVKSAVGVDFGHYKKTTIRRRVICRLLLYKPETLREYIDFKKKNPSEARILYNELLINVTSFFRDEQTMIHLKKHVLPNIIKHKVPGQSIRIWVSACSTGQEAHSLAIMLVEILGERMAGIPVQIFATDLSEAAIARARLGLYTKSEVKEITAGRLERFFTTNEDQYCINKLVRDCVCVCTAQSAE